MSQHDESRRRLITWAWRLPVILAAGGAAYGGFEAIRVHFLKRSAASEPVFDERPETAVAPLSAFAEPWDSAAFELPGAVPLPAVAVRLPGQVPGALEVESGAGPATAHLLAFSRICTHQHCIVSLNTDLTAINFGFNYAASNPSLTCPCHLSVFDPLRGGAAVSGPAVEPLPRIRLELRAGRVVATGLERT